MRSSTLRLSFPFGLTVGLALVILAILVGAAEIIARMPWVESHVPAAVGSQNPYFDIRIGELDYLLAEQGPIDCIFIGSSVVWRGIDPALFADHYRQQTGDGITCFNFGMPGSRAARIVDQAEMLIERYHPRLLIYGFTLRAVADDPSQGDIQDRLFDTPWVKYQRGDWNLAGWLVDHSLALRRYLAVRDWADPAFQSPLGDLSADTRRGFEATYYQHPFFAPPYFADFEASAADWDAFAQFAALASGVDMLLVEVPLPGEALDSFEGGRSNYLAVRDALIAEAGEAAAGRVPVWTTTEYDLIPENGWTGGPLHLNGFGARVFSAWLGDQVGAAVRDGALPDPVREKSQ